MQEGDFILSNSMSFGRPYILKTDGYIHDGWLSISNFNKYFTPDFLYYLLNSNYYQAMLRKKASFGGAVQNLNANIVKSLELPMVPFEIQSEIVRILDNFAELTARKKQYAFYRDMLLTSSNHIEYKTLPDISCNCDRQRKPVTKGKRETGQYPYYGASGIVDYVSDYIFDGDYLLISEDGANLLARSTPIAFSISGQNWVNNHAYVIQFDTFEMQKYVEIYLNSIDLSKYTINEQIQKMTKNKAYPQCVIMEFSPTTKHERGMPYGENCNTERGNRQVLF